MKPSPFLLHITNELEKIMGQPVAILQISPEFGGSINESFKLETDQGIFFLKRNDASTYPTLFNCEAKGLDRLRQFSGFKIPGVVLSGKFKEFSFLLLEYIEKGQPKATFWQQFGSCLANMHQQTHPSVPVQAVEKFGLDHDNFIGSLYQSNSEKESWVDFFAGERLVPLVSMAHEKGKLDLNTVKAFEKLCFKLGEIFPAEPPALLHGDLWSGNFLCSINNEPCIYDPAVYYGHREMDLAMMQLFGGFHSDCYKAYQEIYPLENNWKQRVDICNLYPLLVHVNLFGGNYVKQVKTIVTPFA